MIDGMSTSLGFIYGSFNIAFIFKELLSLGFSLLKSLTLGTAKAFYFTFRTLFKPIHWAIAITDPYKKSNKVFVILGIIVLLWLWIKRLKSAAINKQSK